jgi:hypothetical protein
LQLALTIAALSLMVLAAGNWWGERQSPLVTFALQKTGGTLLLARVQGNSASIVSFNQGRQSGLPASASECRYARVVTVPGRVPDIACCQSGACSDMVLGFLDAPRAVIQAWQRTRQFFRGRPMPTPVHPAAYP